jgi:hypothetical protein
MVFYINETPLLIHVNYPGVILSRPHIIFPPCAFFKFRAKNYTPHVRFSVTLAFIQETANNENYIIWISSLIH